MQVAGRIDQRHRLGDLLQTQSGQIKKLNQAQHRADQLEIDHSPCRSRMNKMLDSNLICWQDHALLASSLAGGPGDNQGRDVVRAGTQDHMETA